MEAQPQCTASHHEESGAFRVPLHAPYEILLIDLGLL
jgi:hypothetical protein